MVFYHNLYKITLNFIHMARKFVICTKEGLLGKLKIAWESQDKSILEKAFEVDIEATANIPVFPTEEQIAYLSDIGADIPEEDNYRIYIGEDVKEKQEQYGGVKLPVSVLDNWDNFYDEVILRIRNVAGSPEDN